MRLRIEPTINISDQVRVRSQFDIFDNLILGSTPDSLVNPLRSSKPKLTPRARRTNQYGCAHGYPVEHPK